MAAGPLDPLVDRSFPARPVDVANALTVLRLLLVPSSPCCCCTPTAPDTGYRVAACAPFAVTSCNDRCCSTQVTWVDDVARAVRRRRTSPVADRKRAPRALALAGEQA